MDYDGIELRELERITGPYIPDCIRIFYVDKGIGNKIRATTTDFTAKGIRLLISSLDDDFQKNESIIIHSEDDNYRLLGEIRHIVRIHDNTTYLGIKFHNMKSLGHYISLISSGAVIHS